MITPNSPSTSHQETAVRRSGAALGIVVFLVGIALIGFVFVQAKALFAAPSPALPIPVATPTPSASPSPGAGSVSPEASNAAIAIGGIALDFVKQVLFLLVMCIVGSAMASHGANLFFKACAAAPPVVRPDALPASPPAAPSQKP